MLIPIIENQDGSTNWTGGSMNVRIVGFAWFVITGVTGNGQKVTVTGEFVGIESADPNATLGGYTGLPGGATSVVGSPNDVSRPRPLPTRSKTRITWS